MHIRRTGSNFEHSLEPSEIHTYIALDPSNSPPYLSRRIESLSQGTNRSEYVLFFPLRHRNPSGAPYNTLRLLEQYADYGSKQMRRELSISLPSSYYENLRTARQIQSASRKS